VISFADVSGDIVEVLFDEFTKRQIELNDISQIELAGSRITPGSLIAIDAIETSTAPLARDYKRDGMVDLADYVEWRQHHGTRAHVGVTLGADGDGNGIIDQGDYVV
jgi:hypothetical protein